MNRQHRYSRTTVLAAFALGFALYASAGERTEHDRTQSELSVEAALALVSAARSSADADPLALEQALTALGDASLKANSHASAEAAYSEAVRSAEQHGGRESERVLAPLLGLGNTYAASGHYEESIPLLQRALAIERAEYGLFDVRQQDTLKTLADSLTALHRIPEAQDLLIYRARVAEKAYGEGDLKVAPVLYDLGDWFAETGKSPEARMTYLTALNIIMMKRSTRDILLVEPLRGIARTSMRRVSYPETWLYPPSPPACSRPGSGPGQECRWPFRMDSGGKRIVLPRKLDSEGEDALRKALHILESDPGAPIQPRVETLIQLGDWYQIKKAPGEALTYYRNAMQLIRTTPDLPPSTATALDVPQRVYYPTPKIVANIPVSPEDVRFHSVQVEFTVNADGSVSKARVVNQDTRDRYARDVLHAVEASRFRPKFIEGQAVATPGVSYREVFRTGKSRT
jgi:TonB family protein